MKKGIVFCDEKICGHIVQTDDNMFVFEYTEDWFNNERTKRCESNILFPFFDE